MNHLIVIRLIVLRHWANLSVQQLSFNNKWLQSPSYSNRPHIVSNNRIDYLVKKNDKLVINLTLWIRSVFDQVRYAFLTIVACYKWPALWRPVSFTFVLLSKRVSNGQCPMDIVHLVCMIHKLCVWYIE